MNQQAKKHLPVFGVGPMYVASIVLITVLARYLSYKKIIYVGMMESYSVLVNVLALGLIVIGVALYVLSLFHSKIIFGIKENHLITSGIYAYVRNPIYSAWLFFCFGFLLLAKDIWLLILYPVFWAYLTIFMKCTEEKWLIAQYGQEYLDYMKKVNRIFPWFSRK